MPTPTPRRENRAIWLARWVEVRASGTIRPPTQPTDGSASRIVTASAMNVGDVQPWPSTLATYVPCASAAPTFIAVGVLTPGAPRTWILASTRGVGCRDADGVVRRPPVDHDDLEPVRWVRLGVEGRKGSFEIVALVPHRHDDADEGGPMVFGHR